MITMEKNLMNNAVNSANKLKRISFKIDLNSFSGHKTAILWKKLSVNNIELKCKTFLFRIKMNIYFHVYTCNESFDLI